MLKPAPKRQPRKRFVGHNISRKPHQDTPNMPKMSPVVAPVVAPIVAPVGVTSRKMARLVWMEKKRLARHVGHNISRKPHQDTPDMPKMSPVVAPVVAPVGATRRKIERLVWMQN